MSNILDDAIVAEARKQGLQPGRDAMTAAALAFAGSRVDGAFIVLPTGQSISVPDAVKGLHANQPEAFARINATDDGPSHDFTGLTAAYLAENGKAKTTRPTDNKYSGLTRQYMDELAAERSR